MFGRALVRLSAAACFAVAGSPAWAQEAAQTAGGDVTADEATPLPPVVVSAPKERRPARANRQTATPQQAPAAAENSPSDLETIATSGSGSDAYATAPGGSVGVFTLGQLDLIGGSTITNEAMWTYNKNSLDQAVDILPGVSRHNAGGSRNESDIYVRGFDRQRVPLSIDGVRIYLPADNRLDLNRFLTPDLSEIQVQKGYVSVLNGPGGMGGAINLVSRKPTKAVELEGRSGVVTGGDVSDLNSWNSYAYAGTRQDMFYGQLSGNVVDQDHFTLSNDFNVVRRANEDGGERELSSFKDWRINAKVGFTPNATDEYSLNYTKQEGQKNAPLHTLGQSVQGRLWDWPRWDTSSASWLSKTQIGEASYVKTNAYYNTFDSDLYFYNLANAPVLRGLTTISPYRDFSYGGFVEAGTNIIPMNTLKSVIHYRRDEHEEGDLSGAGVPVEIKARNVDETWSFAVENTFHATRNIDIVGGVSYDLNEVLLAEAVPAGAPFTTVRQAAPEADAWNWQGAAIYRYSDTGKAHASVSSRTRFPTTFDRYSTRFGLRPPNPFLEPERATNYELGWGETLWSRARISTAVFYSDLEDTIQNVYVGSSGSSAIIGVNASGRHYGWEISGDIDISRTLRAGGNYTYLERDIDFANATGDGISRGQRIALGYAKEEGTPTHEAFLYLAWDATDRLTLTPSIEIASDRNAMITSCRSTLLTGGRCDGPILSPPRPNYVETGAYTRLNLQAEYKLNENFTAAVGATNLLDQNYSLAEGFPEPGRQFFANARVKF